MMKKPSKSSVRSRDQSNACLEKHAKGLLAINKSLIVILQNP